ncbi:MAG: site-specific DNA-methyltransferase [Pirellulaceae bacterium]
MAPKSSQSTTRSERNTVLCGDALNVLPTLPRETVDCLVTSPPYYRQRDYQGDSQVGQEASPQEYVERLVEIFAVAAPVLKPTGSLWLVLGDKYQNGRLLGMPWRVALALQDAGWWLRSDCIWHKPNAMPSSVKTRPTIDHEYIFFFSRQKEYYYNADAIREPHVTFSDKSRMKGGRNHFHKRGGTPETGKNGGQSNLHDGRWDQAFHPEGRNKRTVWSISLSKFREAHFAVFPQSLAETCIKATSQVGGLVLDPFLGSGTTAVAAQALKRDYLGIDQSAEYCEIARRRIAAASSRISI